MFRSIWDFSTEDGKIFLVKAGQFFEVFVSQENMEETEKHQAMHLTL